MRPKLAALAALAALACRGPARAVDDAGAPTDARDEPPTDTALAWPTCRAGERRCHVETHQRCVADGELTRADNRDCAAEGLVCDPARACVRCRPGELRCVDDRLAAERCADDGSAWEPAARCDTARGEACRGGRCVVLCTDDSVLRSNIGCEYFAVDLDNIVENRARAAAAQQYAVVVSNPDPVLTARVEVHRNNALPGEPPRLERVASAVIPPRDLEVFELPAREVDCSTAPNLNDGTGTCLSSRAYRVTANFPVIAFQFNPLDNVEVFSNDASLLVPVNSLDGSYRVLGWPQQYSAVDNPDGERPNELRAFLTVVGTAPNTTVTVTATADIVPGGPLRERLPRGTPVRFRLGPFDVFNLETGSFLADFTGTTVLADQPVAVFSGTECSNVPFWRTAGDLVRACDHLEEQLFPTASAGQSYVLSRTPQRTTAVTNAGARVADAVTVEYFRVLNPNSARVRVTTTLPAEPRDPAGPPLAFDLEPGEFRDLRAESDALLRGDGRLVVGQLLAGQGTTGIPFTLPGGDPSLLIVPPVEQWRSDYVFLTPARYAFDFVQIVARPEARVFLGDGLNETPVDGFADCARARADGCVDTPRRSCPPPAYVTWRCQLSFPRIVEGERGGVATVLPGRQGDGVHTVRAEGPAGGPPERVMVLVSGFDLRVSYAYAGGTNLTPIR